ncbi:putative late blight resistance protein homolog R1A-4 [Solanum dulcamara]|uniref:putative late blight resistance protein homolog R1A-4 n=1 Tax=Solanum dulcamara TaxID=45834 RepID=UPI002486CC89|nr:putative late blight resistance protein homolog R1A-4 [Solanum dulcamara]
MAYAALSSLIHTLQQLLQPKSPLICTENTSIQQQLVESLYQDLCDVQVFLENTTMEVKDIEDVKVLEKRIKDVVYKAEDRIDSSLRSIILLDNGDEMAYKAFNEELQQVEKEVCFLKKEVMMIKFNKHIGFSKSPESATTFPSSRKSTIDEKTVVGMKDDYNTILNCINAQTKELIVISVVGMGGIGKTTLAKKVFDDSTIRSQFDKHAWVTISGDYDKRRMLLEVVYLITGINQEMSNDKLVEIVYRGLKRKRFLIVIDDLWSTEAWDLMRRIFPNDNNRSRIILTTRLKNVADYASSPDFPPHDMSFLSLDDSWNLFTERLFREDPCPPQLEKVGKRIIKQCQGLPLSIIVIAGLLGNIIRTHDNWKKIEENLNSFFGTASEQCEAILSLSYNCLPQYLKACFLYIGSFPEDMEIRVSKLISSWIAEQFIMARSNKRLEVVAEEYLQELSDRCLILVGGRRANGRIRTCKIHDLLRQLCIREAQIENVVHFTNNYVSGGINDHRRVVIPYPIQDYFRDHPEHRNGKITTRSLIFMGRNSYRVTGIYYWPNSISDFKLLKVLDARELLYDFSYIIAHLVHLRYVDANIEDPSSLAKLFNLQTIIIYSRKKNVQLPPEIWTMSEIKHVDIINVDMPNPPLGEQPLFLNNLQTLSAKSSDVVLEILRRIPNLNKLKINDVRSTEWNAFLDCLLVLQGLVTLNIQAAASLNSPFFLSRDILLPNLNKLSLDSTFFPWEVMAVLANLPNLEVLKASNAFWGTDWKLDEDVVFPKLNCLAVRHGNLERWEAISDNFPMLEQLSLSLLPFLEEIPESIGEIMTLKLIVIGGCNAAVITSAKQIRQDQESYGNYELQVRFERY